MKWFIDQNSFRRIRGKYWIVPCINLWYDKEYFLETGVTSPAIGFQISWFNFGYSFIIQKGY